MHLDFLNTIAMEIYQKQVNVADDSIAILILQFSYFNFHMNFSLCKLTIYIISCFSV